MDPDPEKSYGSDWCTADTRIYSNITKLDYLLVFLYFTYLIGRRECKFFPLFFWGGGGGWSRLLVKLTFKLCRAVDPHSFFYESGSSYFLNANLDPAFTKYIKNTLM